MTRNNDPQFDVAIVGGGVAGAHAAATLLDSGASVAIVERTGNHQFITRLAAVAGRTAPVTDAAVPLTEMFDAPVMAQTATSVRDQNVHLDDGSTVRARHVIITAGAEPVRPDIDGLDHALPLRSAEDALAIRAAVSAADAVVIIGGGPTGCQLAGAISHTAPDIDVTVVDGSDRLMANFKPALGHHAGRILRSRGVSLSLGHDAQSLSPGSVQLEDGATVTGTPLWAAGYSASMENFGPCEDGRLRIDTYGRVQDQDRIWAAGDAAAHPNGQSLMPMSAQIAAQAGQQVAKNVRSELAKADTTELSLHDRGWVVDLGGGAGVAEVLGIPVATAGLDRIVPVLHELIDVRNLWQMGGADFVRRFRSGTLRSNQKGSVLIERS